MNRNEAHRELINSARHANQARAWERADRRERQADNLIGELNRNGQIVHYINLRTGKTKEGSRFELVAYLVKNNYV